MTKHDTVIIGAGMTGVSCARALADAGHNVTILDKGRGIGGRLATRRTADGWQFDHGAQYVTAKGGGFSDVLTEMQAAGVAGLWDDGGEDHVVGLPGMSALAKHLARDLPVHQKAEVAAISRTAEGWKVRTEAAVHHASRLVLTIPAPQAMTLLGPDDPLSGRLETVTMLPSVTLMAVLRDGLQPFLTRRDAEDPMAWIALNSSKPGRAGPGCWVAQGGQRTAPSTSTTASTRSRR